MLPGILKSQVSINLVGAIVLTLTLCSLTENSSRRSRVLWNRRKTFHGIRRLYPEGYFGNETAHYSDEMYPATAFTFLARNGETYLAENLIFVDRELLAKCVDWRVFYVGNDSI